jgi:predicted metal-dependent hydrolase
MRDLVRRRLDLDFDPSSVPRDWYGGDAHMTTMVSALSVLFPEGERFFVDSVRRYKRRVRDPELLAAVDGFIGQEAMHGRGHRAFNEMIRAHVDEEVVEGVDGQLRRLLGFFKATLPPAAQLAVTCALEHFTAILAEQLLGRDDHRDAIDESVRGLWLWHALEESEHKAVAFDVYQTIGGGYPLRVVVMATTTLVFFAEAIHVHARLLRARGELGNRRGWAGLRRRLWKRPGLLRLLVPAYLDYYRRDFHPDDRDTSALLREWQERLFGEEGELRDRLVA